MNPTRARLLAKLTLALAATATAALPVLVASRAEAQAVTAEERCKAKLSTANRRYTDRVLQARIRCENSMLTGNLPLATNCLTGRGDDRLDKKLRRAENRLSNSGAACNGVDLELLGFPGSCEDETGDPFDTIDFQDCVIENTDAVLATLLDYYYPPIPDFYRGFEAECLVGSPEDGSASLQRKMRAREKCLSGQEFGTVPSDVECYAQVLPYGEGTGSEDVDEEVSRAYVTLLGAIPQACAEIQVDELDYQSDCVDESGGVFTVIDLKRCFFNANRNAALGILGIVYPPAGICGDGIVGGEEQCDDGNDNSDTTPNACREDCTNPVCHDGVTDSEFGETCDDGNTVNGDCCSGECVADICGDGVENCNEECDTGSARSDVLPDSCRLNCEDFGCGDGVEDTGEQCDDGNSASEDGCSSLCFDEFCGDEIVQGGLGEQCDNGVDNANEPDKCRATGPHACKNPKCGDEIVDTGETCDDGNTVNGDGCESTCSVCGDNIKAPGEECDGDSSICPAGEGCNSECGCEAACPTVGELVLYSGVGADCGTNADCPIGTCEDGKCRTVTRLDSGWTGGAHFADINDAVLTRGFLECDGHGPTCGECSVVGVDPSPGNCRCANSSRTICDEPFVADADDCGGAVCNCYFGAPFPLSSQGTPACIVNRFSEPIFGTANVDLGAGEITARLRTQVHLGIATTNPCPTCGGTCSNAPSTYCDRDLQCPGGTCNLDPIASDGVRGGVCSTYPGSDSGLPCDVMAINTSFPAFTSGPNGGGYSLDCLPNNNVSGQGLVINLTQTTGTSSLTAQVSCLGNSPELDCPCLVCSGDPFVPCNSDQDCASQQGSCALSTGSGAQRCDDNADCVGVDAGICQGTMKCQFASSFSCTTNADCDSLNVGNCNLSTCSKKGSGSLGTFPLPNACENQSCSDVGDGVGECTTGPDDLFCAGVVKANGTGILACQDDDGCAPSAVGIDARPCTLLARKSCFTDPIVATGDPDPETPIGASAFCVPPTSNSAINDVAGLPGPGRVINQAKAKTFCGNDTTQQYIPGVGGCIEGQSGLQSAAQGSPLGRGVQRSVD